MPVTEPVVLFFKSRVDPYVRGGRIVRGYDNRKLVNHRKDAGPSQLALVFPNLPHPGQHRRDADGNMECPTCRYPHKGDHCSNPGCEANPSVSESTKKGWRADREKRAADEAERNRIRDIRSRAMAPEEKKKFYVTVIRNPGPNQKVGYLAGPFDEHEHALAHVHAAREHASKIDPATDFDYFGTTGVTLPEGKHRPGVLNAHMGLGS